MGRYRRLYLVDKGRKMSPERVRELAILDQLMCQLDKFHDAFIVVNTKWENDIPLHDGEKAIVRTALMACVAITGTRMSRETDDEEVRIL